MMQYKELNDTVYFHFGANDTSGSGGDGATPLADVRLAGAAASAAPVFSPTPALLTDTGYPAGCYELAVAATSGNGFAADNTYAVFCTLTIDSQNPTGFVGSFTLSPVLSNPWDEPMADHKAADSFGKGMFGLVPISGQVLDALATDQDFNSDGFTEATSGHFAGSVVVFTSGALLGQCRVVSTYTATNQNFAFDRAWASAPAENDEFVVIGPSPGVMNRSQLITTQGRGRVDIERWQTGTPNALVSGAVDADVSAIQTGAVDAAAIATDAIGPNELAPNAIGATQIAADAIGASQIATGAIDAAAIDANAITATKIATDAITSTKIAANAIGASELATDAIGDAQIATGAIASTAFAAGAIDAAALATDAVSEIADGVLSRDIDNVEGTMALHSLGTAVLKAISRIRDNAGTLEIYRTNGTTLHMSQTVTTDASADPIDELTAGV